MTELLTFLDARSGSYALLANVGGMVPDEPFQLEEGMSTRRASTDDIAEIREIIEYYRPEAPRGNPFENRLRRVGPTSENVVPSSETEFRYHLVEFIGGNLRVHQLVESSCLTNTELDLAIDVSRKDGGWSLGQHDGLQRAYRSFDDDYFQILSNSQLCDLRLALEKYRKHNSQQLVDLGTTLAEYVRLRQIPDHMPIRYLGHCALLESLITHDPRDSSDSLTRQVVAKMSLLNHRFPEPLPYDVFFAGLSADRIWKKLYAYRSAIAHGSRPDFQGSELRPLRDASTCHRFLQLALRRVMRQVLEEPQLIVDLRAC